jgi:hypothetical protein
MYAHTKVKRLSGADQDKPNTPVKVIFRLVASGEWCAKYCHDAFYTLETKGCFS